MEERIHWLTQYADEHGGIVTTTDREMLAEFHRRWPSVKVRWGANPVVTAALREAYRRGLFARRVVGGRGGATRWQYDVGTWSLGYIR